MGNDVDKYLDTDMFPTGGGLVEFGTLALSGDAIRVYYDAGRGKKNIALGTTQEISPTMFSRAANHDFERNLNSNFCKYMYTFPFFF